MFVFHQRKSHFFNGIVLCFFDFFIVKLKNFSTVHTHDMIVMFVLMRFIERHARMSLQTFMQ